MVKPEEAVSRALRSYCQGNRDAEKTILREFRDASGFIAFLVKTLEDDIEENIFTEQDGYNRGRSDGRAEQALATIDFIRSLSYDQ